MNQNGQVHVDFIVLIPDPKLRQFEGKCPNFITHIPEDLRGVEIHVEQWIMETINENINAGIVSFLKSMTARAEKLGLTIKSNDYHSVRKTVFYFG